MDPEFWYQQHTLDSNVHHLNNHMIGMVPKYMRGDATRMETYIELGSLVYDYKHCKRNFARSKLTMDDIRSMHANFYDMPDGTRYNASANSSNQKIKLLEEVTINDSEQSQQTISPILKGTGTQCIDQKALLTSDKEVLCPDWVAGLERETVTCEDVTFKRSTSLPILEVGLSLFNRDMR